MFCHALLKSHKKAMNKPPLFSQPGQPTKNTQDTGTVYLVGAGPGDPDLLTLRAVKLLGQADAVVYDHLVGTGVFDFIRADAERIYVGKEKDRHTLPQDEINTLLVSLSRQGKRVVRLKGGDPFIFGRGGEEAEALVENGIPFEIVPGITAAIGISCYTGIPLTHRNYAQSVVFTTGHLKDGSLNLDWAHLVSPRQTVVIYMGLGGLAEIARQLIAYGQTADMPAAVVEQGASNQQRVVVGTLGTLPDLVAATGLKSPCLIIVGEVVTLHGKLQWFQGAAADCEAFVAAD